MPTLNRQIRTNFNSEISASSFHSYVKAFTANIFPFMRDASLSVWQPIRSSLKRCLTAVPSSRNLLNKYCTIIYKLIKHILIHTLMNRYPHIKFVSKMLRETWIGFTSVLTQQIEEQCYYVFSCLYVEAVTVAKPAYMWLAIW